MKMVEAIVRTVSFEGIVESLELRGVKGMTICEMKGTGEQVQLYKPYTIHNRIEIIVPDERVDKVTDIILEHGHTGLANDGLITMYPIESMIKIRTKEKIV